MQCSAHAFSAEHRREPRRIIENSDFDILRRKRAFACSSSRVEFVLVRSM